MMTRNYVPWFKGRLVFDANKLDIMISIVIKGDRHVNVVYKESVIEESDDIIEKLLLNSKTKEGDSNGQ